MHQDCFSTLLPSMCEGCRFDQIIKSSNYIVSNYGSWFAANWHPTCIHWFTNSYEYNGMLHSNRFGLDTFSHILPLPAGSQLATFNVWGFLKFLNADLFPDGQRQLLTDEQIGICFYLLTGMPPHLKVRDLRAQTRGELMLSCIVGVGSWRLSQVTSSSLDPTHVWGVPVK